LMMAMMNFITDPCCFTGRQSRPKATNASDVPSGASGEFTDC
jgi:hypothetical protein